jgi:hypothetical protein
MFENLATLWVMGLVLAGAVVVVAPERRWRLIALAGHWVLVALLLPTLVVWQVVVVRVLTGAGVWLSLWLTERARSHRAPAENSPAVRLPIGLAFRVMAFILVSVAAWYTALQSHYALPGLSVILNIASYLLMGLGLLSVGLAEDPLDTGIGLFLLLAGFQIFYFAIESSLAMVGLLAVVDFGIAWVVSYLTLTSSASNSETAQ